MSIVQIILAKPISIAGGLVGIIAAALWYSAGQLQPVAPAAIEISDGADGGLRYDEVFTKRLIESGRLNKWAALATGLSVLLQSAGSLADR